MNEAISVTLTAEQIKALLSAFLEYEQAVTGEHAPVAPEDPATLAAAITAIRSPLVRWALTVDA